MAGLSPRKLALFYSGVQIVHEQAPNMYDPDGVAFTTILREHVCDEPLEAKESVLKRMCQFYRSFASLQEWHTWMKNEYVKCREALRPPPLREVARPPPLSEANEPLSDTADPVDKVSPLGMESVAARELEPEFQKLHVASESSSDGSSFPDARVAPAPEGVLNRPHGGTASMTIANVVAGPTVGDPASGGDEEDTSGGKTLHSETSGGKTLHSENTISTSSIYTSGESNTGTQDSQQGVAASAAHVVDDSETG